MTTPAFDGTGLAIPQYTDEVAAMNGDLQGEIRSDLDLDPDQPMGQIVGIVCSAVVQGYEDLQSVYDAMDPDNAEKAALDNLCALTGTKRDLDLRGQVAVDCVLSAGTVVPATAQVALDTDATNVWQVSSSFKAPSNGTYRLTFIAVNVGAVLAPAHHLTTIVTPVTGWTSATNPVDATPGALTETDPDLRIKRVEELAAQGAANISATSAAAEKITGVISATTLQNKTMAVDSNGLPPKSYRLIIWDGVTPGAADQDILNCVLANQPCGIQPDGAITGTATDDLGNVWPVAFTRAPQTAITVVITIVKDSTFPAGGGAALQAAIVADGMENRKVGQVASVDRTKAVCFARNDDGTFKIPGIVSITLCTLNGGGVDISPGPLGIATYDTSRTTVNVT